MRSRRFSRSDISKMLRLTGSPQSRPRSMPSRPHASITASARYGLHAGSGIAHLAARAECRAAPGTRTSGDRFFSDHATLTGASCPGTRRLYELTSGLVTATKARAWSRIPAM